MMAHWTYDDWKADDSQWFRPEDDEPDEQPEPDYRKGRQNDNE